MASQEAEYDEYKNQVKFKSFREDFSAQLIAFDKAKEWADLIKCLQRLTRVLSKYSMFPVIPEKLLFCKRLAQCCNPALPPGVHAKTLETYEIVFERIGKDRLAKDLPFYSSGLFPLFAYASMQVKPKIIELISTFFVPLGQNLLPCLSGLIISLSVGLEEQNAESYGKVMKLIDKLGEVTAKDALFHSLWKALSLSPSTRAGVLHYISERIPKQKTPEDLETYMPNRATLVLNALIKATQDPHVLVQRGVLDLILTSFRLEEGLFDLEGTTKLVQRTLLVQLKKEVSLSRRVYQWLLGEADSKDSKYLLTHSKAPLVAAIEGLFRAPFVDTEAATVPFKVLQHLFDKPEVAGPIIHDILPFIFESLHKYKEGFTFSTSIVSQVNILLESIQPDLLWKFICEMVLSYSKSLPSGSSGASAPAAASIDPSLKVPTAFALVESLLHKLVDLNNPSAQAKHLPGLLIALITCVKILLEKQNFTEMLHALQLSLKLIGKIFIINTAASQKAPPPVDSSRDLSKSAMIDQVTPVGVVEALTLLQELFPVLVRNGLAPRWDAEAQQVAKEQSQNDKKLRLRRRTEASAAIWSSSISIALMDIVTQLLVALSKVPNPMDATLVISGDADNASAASEQDSGSLPEWFLACIESIESTNPLAACLGVRTFVGLLFAAHNSLGFPEQLKQRVVQATPYPTLAAKKLWELLHQSLSIVHYKSVELFMHLKEVCLTVCEDVISEELLNQNVDRKVQAIQRFALLWRLTGEISSESVTPLPRNLFYMFDTLNDDMPIVRLAGRSWLAEAISKLDRIMDPLLLALLDPSTARSGGVYKTEYDFRKVLYIFKTLRAIVESDFRLFIFHVSEKTVSLRVLQANDQQTIKEGDKPALMDDFANFKLRNYLDLLVLTSLRFMSGLVPPKSSAEYTKQNSVVQTTSTEFLQFVLSKVTNEAKATELATTVLEPVLQNLATAVSQNNLILQAKLLSLLRSLILLDSAPATRASISEQPPAVLLPGGVASAPGNLSSGSIPTLASSPSSSQLPTANAPAAAARSTAVADLMGKSQMFIQTLLIGLLQPPTSFNIRFYWLEFITGSLHYLARHSAKLIGPILSCLCDIINSHEAVYESVGTNDAMLLLKTLSYINSFCLSASQEQQTRVAPATAAQQTSTSGISSFFKTIFLQEDVLDNAPAHRPDDRTSVLLSKLPSVVESIIRLWGPPTTLLSKLKAGRTLALDFSKDETHNRYAIQDQIIHIMEPLFAAFPTRCLMAILQLWKFSPSAAFQQANTLGAAPSVNVPLAVGEQFVAPDDLQMKLTIIELLNTMSNVESENVTRSITEIVRWSHLEDSRKLQKVPPNRRKPGQVVVHSTDSILMDFVFQLSEIGTQQLTENGWLALLMLAREMSVSVNPFAILLTFRIIEGQLAKSNKFTNRKIKKDLQDMSQKFIDLLMMIVNRNFTDLSGSFKNTDVKFNPEEIASSGVVVVTPPAGTLSPSSSMTRESSSSMIREPAPSVTTVTTIAHSAVTASGMLALPPDDTTGLLLPGDGAVSMPADGAIIPTDAVPVEAVPAALGVDEMEANLKRHLCLFALAILAGKIPVFMERLFEGEKERMLPIVGTIVHTIYVFLKSKGVENSNDGLSEAHLRVLVAFSQSEFIDMRSWRKEILDHFLYGIGFFKADKIQLKLWGQIINQMFKQDATVWQDLIRIATKSLTGQNIFMSKADENKNRSLNIKRMAFVIFSGAPDQYAEHIPLIQEKLAEALRVNKDNPKLVAKVFLCLRVLLVRVSATALRSFWPVIISEMIRILDTTPLEPEQVLAVSKFLDLVLIHQDEEFNHFDWMFISDQPAKQTSTFVPWLDRVARISPNSRNSAEPKKLNYKPARPAPIITMTKLQTLQNKVPGFGGLGSSQMTWDGFVDWLGQYQTLAFGNRFATSEHADRTTIEAILLNDFSSLKFKGLESLEIDEFAVLRSPSSAAAAASAADNSAAPSDGIASFNPFANTSLAGLKLI